MIARTITLARNNVAEPPVVDFGKIAVGAKTLRDATLNIGNFDKNTRPFTDKKLVYDAIIKGDLRTMRQISDFWYSINGIYSRVCKYMAYLYTYDWFIIPCLSEITDVKKDGITQIEDKKKEKTLEIFYKGLKFIDEFNPKKNFASIALTVIRQGCYYGYIVAEGGKIALQDLPIDYCRSRYKVNGKPVVEFNMRFFDDAFRSPEQRVKMLKLFPDDFKRGYIKYKNGKLPPEFPGDTSGWYMLEVGSAIKFNLGGSDVPLFISAIPALIDLDEAQDLNKKKMEQQLLKILIQKLPLDKNNEMIFSPEEARDMHNNAVQMLAKAIGLDVLTTFAETEVKDMSDDRAESNDDLEVVERSTYNEFGVPQMVFNASGNIALTYSIANDEASVYELILQFEEFLNFLLTPFNRNPKKFYLKAQVLKTTIYNYKDMAKLYKEQASMGYNKLLPQIALGQSQLSILYNAFFENRVIELWKMFIPPVSSNTMSAEWLLTGNNTQQNNSNSNNNDSNITNESRAAVAKQNKGEVGRPEKADEEKSTKTLQNRESLG